MKKCVQNEDRKLVFYVSDLALTDPVYGDLLNLYLSIEDEWIVMKHLPKLASLVQSKKKRNTSATSKISSSNKENLSSNQPSTS